MGLNEDIRKTEEGGGRMVKEILSQSKNSAFRKAANSIRQGASIGEALQFVADNTVETPTNSVVGNLFTIIGQQWVESHFRKIYGNVFKAGEDLIAGGINIVLPVVNGAGISQPTNYQTSTDTTGVIAFGPSVSNTDIINLEATIAPLNTSYTYGLGGNSTYNPFATLNMTVPTTFASFSGLTAIKAGEIISTYTAQLTNSLQIYYNNLGNLLFQGFLPINTYATTSTNIYQMLQLILIPMIERFKQVSARFNAGINYMGAMTNPNDTNYFQQLDNINLTTMGSWTNLLPSWMSVNNSVNANQPYLNNTDPDKLVMYMSPATMSAFLTMLETNAIGKNVVDIETQGNLVTRIAGVRVVVTGTIINNSPQTTQGTTIQATLDSGQALPYGDIVLINEDYLTFHKYYEKQLETDSFVNAMVKVIRYQISYLPIVRPWLNGIVISISSCLNNTNALNVNVVSNSN